MTPTELTEGIGERKMTKHKPGPWKAYSTARINSRRVFMPNDVREIHSADGGFIACTYYTNHDINGNVDAANVNLIAAAPDLLAALYDACSALEDFIVDGDQPGLQRVYDAGMAAIAKAEGRDFLTTTQE